MSKKETITVQGTEITLLTKKKEDYISLTDIAKYRNVFEPFSIINNWMRNRSTIEFLGLWEYLNNPDFKPIEFDRFKMEAGSNYFVLSPQRWIDATNAIGIISKSGRYGGTYAHEDIAFEFSSWISSEFKLYLVTEFKRCPRLCHAGAAGRPVKHGEHQRAADSAGTFAGRTAVAAQQRRHYADEIAAGESKPRQTAEQMMKEQIRELIMSLGADICGFAHIGRFDNAPHGFNPADIFSDCKTVISFGIALPKGLARISPRLIYGYYNSFCFPEVDRIAFSTAKRLEKEHHCTAVPLPCDSPYEYWDGENMEGRGLLSMKHIAVAAGLGEIGKNTLLLNKQYGNMLTIGAVLTDLKLTSDPLAGNICMERCRKCITACPVNAIESGIVNQKLCRMHTYGKTKRGFDTVDCNFCRTVCPMCYGIE